MAAVALWSAVGGWCGMEHGRPVAWGARGAAMAVVVLVVTDWADDMATGLLSGRAADSWRDLNFRFDVIVSPVLLVLFYAPLAALFGAAVGAVVGRIGRGLRRAGRPGSA
jgi:hypothetical protein